MGETVDWLNYHHLMNFWLVAREGSVQGASELLHVTPASVSVQVKQLEKSLGVKLLQRKGRGVVLTPIGEEVEQYAAEIFSTGQEMVEMLRGKPSGKPKELRVGVRDAMPKLVAFQLLKPALELPEPVKLVCLEAEMPELVADLAIHKLDVILSDTALDPIYKVRAYSHRLGESDVAFVGIPELANAYRKNFPSSLDGAPLIVPTSTNVLRHTLDQWFYDLNLKPEIKGEFADSAMLKIAGKNGLGLLPIPVSILADVTELYGLVEVGVVRGVKERFFAISVERKLRHPAVVAISEGAIKTS